MGDALMTHSPGRPQAWGPPCAPTWVPRLVGLYGSGAALRAPQRGILLPNPLPGSSSLCPPFAAAPPDRASIAPAPAPRPAVPPAASRGRCRAAPQRGAASAPFSSLPKSLPPPPKFFSSLPKSFPHLTKIVHLPKSFSFSPIFYPLPSFTLPPPKSFFPLPSSFPSLQIFSPLFPSASLPQIFSLQKKKIPSLNFSSPPFLPPQIPSLPAASHPPSAVSLAGRPAALTPPTPAPPSFLPPAPVPSPSRLLQPLARLRLGRARRVQGRQHRSGTGDTGTSTGSSVTGTGSTIASAGQGRGGAAADDGPAASGGGGRAAGAARPQRHGARRRCRMKGAWRSPPQTCLCLYSRLESSSAPWP